MKLLAPSVALSLTVLSISSVAAQSLPRSPAPPSDSAQLQVLTRKIEEQNAKIDTLSQQILKLEQQVSNLHPGVMVGEATPTATASAVAAAPEATPHPTGATANGNTHTVARGETLTSIAKIHNVTVSELQKFNHIENDRKLQIGQTIMIPGGSATPAPSASSPAQ